MPGSRTQLRMLVRFKFYEVKAVSRLLKYPWFISWSYLQRNGIAIDATTTTTTTTATIIITTATTTATATTSTTTATDAAATTTATTSLPRLPRLLQLFPSQSVAGRSILHFGPRVAGRRGFTLRVIQQLNAFAK